MKVGNSPNKISSKSSQPILLKSNTSNSIESCKEYFVMIDSVSISIESFMRVSLPIFDPNGVYNKIFACELCLVEIIVPETELEELLILTFPTLFGVLSLNKVLGCVSEQLEKMHTQKKSIVFNF